MSSNSKKKKKPAKPSVSVNETNSTKSSSTPSTTYSFTASVNGDRKLNPTTSSVPMDELAFSEFTRGNVDFHQSNYSSSIIHYTKAVAMVASSNTNLLLSVFVNRAITQLHLKDYKQCVEDSNAAISLEPKHLKSYICRAFAHFYLKNYEKSLEDYETSFKLQSTYPTNQLVQVGLQKAREELLAQQKKKGKLKDLTTNSFFGLLNIEEEEYKAPKTTNTTAIPVKKLDSEPPMLIPIGEVLSNDCAVENYIEVPRKEAEELAAKEKEQGNRAYAASNFSLALVHYSKAIKLNWKESVFFSNRALVYLKLNRFYESISDCTASIDRKPSIKAYARRAAAWAFLKEYYLAAEDYKRALRFEPKNGDCLEELKKCLVQLEKDYQLKLEIDPGNEKIRKSVNNVREDLKKIASKIEKDQKEKQ